jgi:hypothetical protein
LQAAQKDPEARRAKHQGAKAYLQYVAAMRFERKEAYGSFSSLNGMALSSQLQADFLFFAMIAEEKTSVFCL